MINILNYSFEGPYNTPANLQNKAGVYAILCLNNSKYTPVDIGESADVKTRVENHDRKSCWSQKCSAQNLHVAVYYTPNMQQSARIAIEQELRSRFPNLCGDK